MRLPRPFRFALVLALVLAPGACKKKDVADGGSAPGASAASGKAPAANAPSPTPPPTPAPNPPKGLDAAVLKLLPKKSATVFLLPSLEETGRLVKLHLERHAMVLGIEGKVDDFLQSLLLGAANPFDAAARARWAIDGKRPSAFALDPEGKTPLIVLPVTSFEAFEKGLRAKLTEGGPATYEVVGADASKLTLVKRGDAVILGYAGRDGHAALVAADEGVSPRAALETFLKVTPGDSISASPSFQASAGRLTSLEDLLVYFDGEGLYQLQLSRGGPLSKEEKANLHRIFEVVQGLAIAVDLTEKDILAQGYLSLAQAARWAPIFNVGRGNDAALLRFLDADSGITAKLSVDGSALLGKLLELDPALKNSLNQWSGDLEKRLGLHVERDLLRNIVGKVALGTMGFDPDFPAATADPKRRMEVLAKMHVVAVAELRDRAAFEKALSGAKAVLEKRGPSARLGLAEKAHGASKYYELSFQGKALLCVAVVDNTLLLTMGGGRMQKALELAQGKGSALLAGESAAKKALLGEANFAANFSFGAALAHMRALDLSPLGRRGAELKVALDQKIAPLFGALRDLTVEARWDGQGIKAQAALRGK